MGEVEEVDPECDNLASLAQKPREYRVGVDAAVDGDPLLLDDRYVAEV
jgi:hypothetical protein